MSGEQNLKQESVVRRTQFDYMGSDNLYLNLKIGSPSESQLKMSSEVLKRATVHRLVKRNFVHARNRFLSLIFCHFTE